MIKDYLWRKVYIYTLWLSYVFFLITGFVRFNIFDEILYFTSFAYSLLTLRYMNLMYSQATQMSKYNGIVNLGFPIVFMVLKTLSMIQDGISVFYIILCALLLGFGIFNFRYFRKHNAVFTQPYIRKKIPSLIFFKIYTYVLLPLYALTIPSILSFSTAPVLTVIWTIVSSVYIAAIIITVKGLHKKVWYGFFVNRYLLKTVPYMILIYIFIGFYIISKTLGAPFDFIGDVYTVMPAVYPMFFICLLISIYFFNIRPMFIFNTIHVEKNMLFNREKLISDIQNGKVPEYEFFWGHTPPADGRLTNAVFSQWWDCRFTIDGKAYHTAEQYMMAEKARLFGDEETLAKIMSADNPAEYKKLGREVKNFDNEKWEKNRFNIVMKANRAKFFQNKDLLEYLLSTGEKVLVEASPYDQIWGIGLSADNPDCKNPEKWQGENLLGFALMETRAILKYNQVQN